MKRIFIILSLLFLTSCSFNVTHTKIVEMPDGTKVKKDVTYTYYIVGGLQY